MMILLMVASVIVGLAIGCALGRKDLGFDL